MLELVLLLGYSIASPGLRILVLLPQLLTSLQQEVNSHDNVDEEEDDQDDETNVAHSNFDVNTISSICKHENCHCEREVDEFHDEDEAGVAPLHVGLRLRQIEQKRGGERNHHHKLKVSGRCVTRTKDEYKCRCEASEEEERG